MQQPSVRVWFNRHFSTIGRVLLLLRQAQNPMPIWTCVSHRHSHFSGFAGADHAMLEPAGLDSQSYLEWCLATVQALGITHLVPGHEQSFLTARADAFAKIGCSLIGAAVPEILPNLHRKEWVYEKLSGAVPIPPYLLVSTIDDALHAIEALRKEGEVSVKPTVSIYGKGFYRLIEEGPVSSDVETVPGWEARVRARERFDPHLVMRYLPGPEYSVDLAARHGEMLACVIRKKGEADKVQNLLEHRELTGYAAEMVRRFGVNGLANIQFKEDVDGSPYLLEINPRASGGLGMSCISGVNLPDIAYRAAIFPDEPVVVPKARTGIRVTEISLAVELPRPEPLPVADAVA